MSLSAFPAKKATAEARMGAASGLDAAGCKFGLASESWVPWRREGVATGDAIGLWLKSRKGSHLESLVAHLQLALEGRPSTTSLVAAYSFALCCALRLLPGPVPVPVGEDATWC